MSWEFQSAARLLTHKSHLSRVGDRHQVGAERLVDRQVVADLARQVGGRLAEHGRRRQHDAHVDVVAGGAEPRGRRPKQVHARVGPDHLEQRLNAVAHVASPLLLAFVFVSFVFLWCENETGGRGHRRVVDCSGVLVGVQERHETGRVLVHDVECFARGEALFHDHSLERSVRVHEHLHGRQRALLQPRPRKLRQPHGIGEHGDVDLHEEPRLQQLGRLVWLCCLHGGCCCCCSIAGELCLGLVLTVW